jgi:NADH-quinone oxidoreductase subunit F
MDLHSTLEQPTDRERAVVDRALEGFAGEAQIPRDQLLPVLRAVQMGCGWLSPSSLGYVSARMHIPAAEVYGVASFYHLFTTRPSARRVLHLCDDVTCRLRGSSAIKNRLSEHCAPECATRTSPSRARSKTASACGTTPTSSSRG